MSEFKPGMIVECVRDDGWGMWRVVKGQLYTVEQVGRPPPGPADTWRCNVCESVTHGEAILVLREFPDTDWWGWCRCCFKPYKPGALAEQLLGKTAAYEEPKRVVVAEPEPA